MECRHFNLRGLDGRFGRDFEVDTYNDGDTVTTELQPYLGVEAFGWEDFLEYAHLTSLGGAGYQSSFQSIEEMLPETISKAITICQSD